MTDKLTVKTPLFRCTCGELSVTMSVAKEHVKGRDIEEHRFSGVVECDRCDGHLGRNAWVRRHNDDAATVYCSPYCADFPDTPDGDMPLETGECSHPVGERVMARDVITHIPQDGEPPDEIAFPGYCGECGANVSVVYALQRAASRGEA